MSVHHGDLTFERLGHASVRIDTSDGQVIYIDPWSQALDDAPHDADVIFVTHDDRDHYDPDAIEAVKGSNTKIAAYEAIDTSDLDPKVLPLAYEETLTIDGIEVQTVPAHNRPDGNHTDENGEPFHAKREVIGLILTIDDTSVYFTSDTDFLDDHPELEADVFIPPIGGHFTMTRLEAVRFAQSVNPELVLPVHYDTFEQIQTNANAFKEDLEANDISVRLF